MKTVETILIVGCGGVTSHLITPILHNHHLILMDGDKFEPHNTVRQIGAHVGNGKNKAEVYCEMFGKYSSKSMKSIPEYIADNTAITGIDLILTAVDNHDARLACKKLADRLDIPMIWGANEEEDPQAMLYLPAWSGTNRDPFVRYDIKPDGRGPLESCTTTEAIEAAPQLPIANHNAASFMLWLLNAYLRVRDEENLPMEVLGTRNGIQSTRLKNIPETVSKPEPALTL
jgi:molybdopterin/thiamine biosynthesis adenylyltransferase